jgi:hypothetical protein
MNTVYDVQTRIVIAISPDVLADSMPDVNSWVQEKVRLEECSHFDFDVVDASPSWKVTRFWKKREDAEVFVGMIREELIKNDMLHLMISAEIVPVDSAE